MSSIFDLPLTQDKRAHLFDAALAAIVCVRLVEGESLAQICKDSDMPNLTIWHQWLSGLGNAPDTLQNDYARARREQADTYASQIMEIADGMDENVRLAVETELKALNIDDYETKEDFFKAVRVTEFFAKRRSIEASKAMIDARKWTAGRMNPAAWGDKVQIEANIKTPPPVRQELAGLTTEQLERVEALQEELTKEVTAMAQQNKLDGMKLIESET